MNALSARLRRSGLLVVIGCALVAGASAQSLNPRGLAASQKALNVGTFVFCNGLENPPGCASTPATSSLIALEQLSPLRVPGNSELPIEFRAGWPIIYRATIRADYMLGIGLLYGRQSYEPLHWYFPEVAQGGAIVFEDPDNAWSFVVPSNLPHDELLVDFYPDPGDVSGVVDDVIDVPLAHDPTIRFNLRPEFGGPLPQRAPGGGQVQSVTQDGVQFGADDDFSGLVIVSNTGVGVVMTSLANGWQPVLPRQARNLAGFTTSVGYELNDVLDQTSITAILMVPRFLFSHIRLRDHCVGAVTMDMGVPVSCAGAPVQRVDGGPISPWSSSDRNDESIVEIRAFVVAPVWNSVSNRLESLDTVVDMNGDGQITAADAGLMGRQVLSNEVVFSFRQIGSDVTAGQITPFSSIAACNGGARPDTSRLAGSDMEFDIDGNGYAILDDAVVCPGGGSGTSQPPR